MWWKLLLHSFCSNVSGYKEMCKGEEMNSLSRYGKYGEKNADPLVAIKLICSRTFLARLHRVPNVGNRDYFGWLGQRKMLLMAALQHHTASWRRLFRVRHITICFGYARLMSNSLQSMWCVCLVPSHDIQWNLSIKDLRTRIVVC